MAPPFEKTGFGVRVLGELEIVHQGQVVALPPSKKTRALLAYLAVTARPHRRDRLCSLLWDVADDPRGALRWSVSKLRQVCDRDETRIVADRDTIALFLREGELDLWSVRRALAEGACEHASLEALSCWAETTRGDFLEGLELSDFHEFSSWCVAEREEVRKMRIQFLNALVKRSPSPEHALVYARALALADPVNQSARANLIELSRKLGLLDEAEQHYQNARQFLKDLGLEASVELDRARKATPDEAPRSTEQIKAKGAWGPLTSAPTPSAPPLVGRTREQDALGSVFAQVRSEAKARVVVLCGDAGSGKSRLLREFMGTIPTEGSRLTSAAYEVEVGRPYGPWIDALRQIPRSLVGSELARSLCTLVPEWKSPGPASRPSQEEVTGAVAELLAARLHSTPFLAIAIDDAHWLDDASSQLLHYLVRVHRYKPLLVILTARGGEMFDNLALMKVLRSFKSDGLAAELTLDPLSDDEVTELAAQMAPGPLLAEVVRKSAGNPLYAIELARHLGQGREGIPKTLSQLVQERVQALPEAVQEPLLWAAILGSTFSVNHLQAVSSASPMELAEALEWLERHAMIRRVTDPSQGNHPYSFSHQLVHQAIVSSMSDLRRRLMHQRVVDRLEVQLSSSEGAALELMRHATLAGQPEVAVRACIRAAARCVELFAAKEAEALVRRGFAAVEALKEEAAVPLTIQLWQVKLAARRPGESASVVTLLRELGERALRIGSTESARLAFHLLSWLRWEEGELSDAMKASIRAEQLSRDLPKPERMQAMAESARCLVLVERDLPQAEALLLEAMALADEMGVPSLSVLDAKGMLHCHRGEMDQAIDCFERATRLAQSQVDRLGEFQIQEHRICALLEAERWKEASEVTEDLCVLAEKLRHGSEIPVAQTLRALVDYRRFSPGAHLRFEEALSNLRGADVKQRLACSQLFAAEADLLAGRRELAETRASEALLAASELHRPSDCVIALVFLARCAEERGDRGAVARHLQALDEYRDERISARARAFFASTGEGLSHARKQQNIPNGTRHRRTAVG